MDVFFLLCYIAWQSCSTPVTESEVIRDTRELPGREPSEASSQASHHDAHRSGEQELTS